MEAFQSLRDEFQTMKKSTKEVEVNQTSDSASKPGTSKQTDTLPLNTALNTQPQLNTQPFKHTDEPMEMDTYGPTLPPWFSQNQSAQSEHGSDPSPNIPNRCVRLEPKNMWTKGSIRFGQNIFLSLHLQRRISPLFM